MSPMLQNLLNRLAITIAFTAGAIVMALVLDVRLVQDYLGMAAIPVEDLLRLGLAFVATAAATGLVVDGLRLLARVFWRKRDRVGKELEDLFRASLA